LRGCRNVNPILKVAHRAGTALRKVIAHEQTAQRRRRIVSSR
jgi:hypothetical protein